MSRPPRVLHVIQNLNYGGMERLVADLVHTLADRVESHVLTLQYVGRFGQGLGDVATLHHVTPRRGYSMIWPRALANTIAAIAPDVVHTHGGVWYKASLAARIARVPQVMHTDHGRVIPDPWVARVLDRRAARRTDVVVAVSHRLGDHLARHIVRGSAPVRVIENGVDSKQFSPRPDDGGLRQELGLAAATPIIGSVGRLEAVKGYDVMLEAFRRLLELGGAGAAPVLVIAGNGSERHGLERVVVSAGLRDRVHLLGWRDDIHQLHRAFTLFTMASRSEGTSVSLLQAMGAGLCPVVTDVGGNRRVLGSDLSHRLVPAGDCVALSRAWEEALVAPERRERDGTAARRRVLDAFTLEAMADAYARLYTRAH